MTQIRFESFTVSYYTIYVYILQDIEFKCLFLYHCYMADTITKKEMEGLFSEQTKVILGAMDERFQKMDMHLDTKLDAMTRRMDEFDKKLDRLTTTLDKFLKRLTDHEEEFTLLKADVAQIKAVLKEKLGVEILIQGR